MQHSKPTEKKNKMSKVQKQSILVIDDSTENLELNKLILEMENYEVFTAESGEDALKILSEIAEPNLILLDMNMADMNGTEFLTILEDIMPDIVKSVPVVFLTGADKIPESKAAGHIRKPAERDKFLTAVRNFIAMGNHTPYSH